jgi:hypothetical protein
VRGSRLTRATTPTGVVDVYICARNTSLTGADVACRDGGQHGVRPNPALASKPAAEKGRDNAHVRRWQAEHRRHNELRQRDALSGFI